MGKTIVFDLRALQIGHEKRGIGAYARSVLEHMPTDDNTYIFYCFDKSNPIEELDIKTSIPYQLVQTPTLNTHVLTVRDLIDSLKIEHHRFTRLKSYRPDVFVQFDFMLGAPKWKNTKVITIGYDLIPLIMKNLYMPDALSVWSSTPVHMHRVRSKIHKLRISAKRMPKTILIPLAIVLSPLLLLLFVLKKLKILAIIKRILKLVHPGRLKVLGWTSYRNKRAHRGYKLYRRSDKVVCISEAAADSFRDILQVPQKKLSTILLAPVIPKAKPSAKKLLKDDKPYIFYIGGDDYRKHVSDIVSSFNIARGRGQDVALVLAGYDFRSMKTIPNPDTLRAIKESPYKDDIHLLGFVSDEEKVSLYKNALAFIFCSTYEGFGLPVLEAQAMGSPVISYNNSSIPEVSSSAVELVDDNDISGVARAIAGAALSDNRQELAAEGEKFAKKFSWDNYCRDFTKLITK